MIMLLIAAIGALVAGVLAILYGIPVKEFSFGNTMVLAGVVGICTGLVMFGLWVTAREMRAMTLRITAPASAGLHEPSLPELGASAPLQSVQPARREPALREPAVAGATLAPPSIPSDSPVFPPFAQTEIEDRPDSADLALPVAAPEPPAKPRRNLLFESSVRKDRESAATKVAPPIDAGSRAINDPMTQRDGNRTDRTQRTRSPSTFSASAPRAASDVTVLKSGVVDGMAYSLYSDGSIEAQMPEGMMRFASIDDLRSHLDGRGA